MRLTLTSISVLLLACASDKAAEKQPELAAPAPAPQRIEFIHDDYARALALAQAEGKPLFVDAWAPWCHTCRSMNAFVFPDEALAPWAGRFVFLSVDTERAENAAFLEKYPIEAWPSLYIIDPKTGQVALRWLGSATVPQLIRLFEDGEQAVKGGGTDAEVLLARADRLYGEGSRSEAAIVYEDALRQAPSDWSRRPRAVESLLFAQWGSRAHEACAKTARAEVPKIPPSASRLNASVLGLSCALSMPKDTEGRAELVKALEALAQEALDAATQSADFEIAADDVSGLFDVLVSAREAAGDVAGKKALAERWAKYLEAEAAAASTPEQRTVFDSHRLLAYLALGEPARALPMLQEAERALPDDYNPPARLAIIYKELGRYDEALAANSRALERVYGPRKIRVLQNRADILAAKGDLAGAKAALEEALLTFEALPKAQQNEKIRQRVQQQRDALPK